MLDATFVVEVFRRRWWAVLIIAVVAGLAGVATMISGGNETLAPTYTAEATIYVDAHDSSEVNEYNYQVDEEFVAGDAQRFVLNDSVAGEVRRTYGEDVVITAPLLQNQLTKLEAKTHFVFIDATAADKDTAMAAANMAADLTVASIEKSAGGMTAVVIDEAALKTSSSGPADFGSDALTVSTVSQVQSSISFKKIIVYVAIGLIVGCALVIILDYCRRRMRTAHDVERLIGVRVIESVKETDAQFPNGLKRFAGLADAIARQGDCESICLCGWGEDERPSGLVSRLNEALVHAHVAGWVDLSSTSSNTSLLVNGDCVVLVVAQNEQNAQQIDEMVQCVRATGLKVLGALFVERSK